MSAMGQVSQAAQIPARGRIEELIYSSGRVASNMHQSDVAYWLREHAGWTRALWQDGELVGLLACTPPLAGNSWLCVCVLQDGVDAGDGFHRMWRPLRATLRQRGAQQVNLLGGQQDWLRDCLPASGFRPGEEVISLLRPFTRRPAPGAGSACIRPAYVSDLEELRRVDAAAFEPRWRMSDMELRLALRRAASFTVAVAAGRVGGFQITTRGAEDAHLARLGVAPQQQGAGLGTQLLADVIRRFSGRRLTCLTVNTLAHNQAALRLYHRFGFRRNGDDYRVWTQALEQGAAA